MSQRIFNLISRYFKELLMNNKRRLSIMRIYFYQAQSTKTLSKLKEKYRKEYMIMKRIVPIALCAVLAAVMLTGCITVAGPGVWWGWGPTGRGALETYTFNVGDIKEVKVELLCDILYYSEPSDSVTLEIQPNLMKHIVVKESDGVLTVRSTRNIRWTGNTQIPVLSISTPSLTCVTHAGAGSFRTVDPIVADSFTLRVAGATNNRAVLDVKSLSVNMDGAGDIKLSGRAETADIDMAGAGKMDALDLQTRDAKVNIAGVGTVRIGCSDNLRVVAAGVGTVEYAGSPILDVSRGGLVTVRNVG